MTKTDLHTHTTASDGSLSPSELTALAAQVGLTCIAITDHDTVKGLRAIKALSQPALEIIPGIELSTTFEGRTVHVLGYHIDPGDRALNAFINDRQSRRRLRAVKILDRLRALGIDISPDELPSGSAVGRPHIGSILVKRGICVSISDAFERFLSKGAPAYVPPLSLDAREAISIIHDAHGAAVLAHLNQIGTMEQSGAVCEALHRSGLDGVECYYSTYDDKWNKFCLSLAAAYGLAATGGSDFHGSRKPDIKLGELYVPDSVLAPLRQRAQRYK